MVIACLVFVTVSCAAQSEKPSQSVLPLLIEGTVTIDGNPAPIGTEIIAVMDNIHVAQMPVARDGSYALLITRDKRDTGRVVEFFVGNIKTDYTVIWVPDGVKRLDMSIETLSREIPRDNVASDLASTGVNEETNSPAGQLTVSQILDPSLLYLVVIVVVLVGVLYLIRYSRQ